MASGTSEITIQEKVKRTEQDGTGQNEIEQ